MTDAASDSGADRRRAPRLAVKSRSMVKVDGEMTQVALQDISPTGARLAAKTAPDIGALAKLYLGGGQVLDATVTRHTEDGFAVAFRDGPPVGLPHKTFFWKLESYAFASDAYAPRKRAAAGRHLPNEAMVQSCSVTLWDETQARLETPIRLAIGERIHVCGRTLRVTGKAGHAYTLVAADEVEPR